MTKETQETAEDDEWTEDWDDPEPTDKGALIGFLALFGAVTIVIGSVVIVWAVGNQINAEYGLLGTGLYATVLGIALMVLAGLLAP